MEFFGLIFLFLKLVCAENVYKGFIPSIIPLKLSKRGDNVNLVMRQVIAGNLILDNIPGDLWQNGKTVQPSVVYEVTGYVHLKNINFNLDLRNLAVIHGEELEPETGAALLIEDSDMQYFNVPNLQVIKKGKVVIRNCKNLCYWNPNEKNGVDYERLVRPEPNSKTKDEINSRISILNSFGNCGGELSSCGNNQQCFWRNIPQIRPTLTGDFSCSKNCATGCRTGEKNGRSIQQCNTCPTNLYLNLETGDCVSCDLPMVNLYCLGTEIDRRHIVDEEGYRALSCSTGYTLEREKNTDGKTMYKCVKCHVGITAAGKFYPSCLKVCPDIAFPKYEYIRRYYPKFSISNYDKDVEYEEYELCSIITGQIFFKLTRDETYMPPESSLWFVSRWQYSEQFFAASEDPDVKLFGNLRDTKVEDELKYNRKYNDFGLLNLPNYAKLGFGNKLWFRPLRKDSRFKNDELYSEKNSDFDCRCGYGDPNADKNAKAECFVPGNCNKCRFGHRQYIDPQTKVMFTRCSRTDFNKSIEFKTDENALPPNTIYPCHKACKAEGCVDKTVFGCKQCAKLDVWSHNLGRACALTCPVGFYKEKTLYKGSFHRCIRCHKGCRGGCTGPSAGRGKGGCNDCFSYISAPRNSSFDAICMGEGNDQMENIEIINRIIRMLAVVSIS